MYTCKPAKPMPVLKQFDNQLDGLFATHIKCAVAIQYMCGFGPLSRPFPPAGGKVLRRLWRIGNG